MDKHLSQKDLDSIYKKELKALGKQGVLEKIEAKRNNVARKDQRSVFLSHSHLDKTIVTKIGLLFEKVNTTLYIDWLDDTLPEKTDNQTASVIKYKIQNCDKFLFLATYHGLRSKWCNWEIGMADSLKSGNNSLAVLPIDSKSGKWKGNEYLQLYPEMKFDTNNFDIVNANDVTIANLDGSSISLESWLNN